MLSALLAVILILIVAPIALYCWLHVEPGATIAGEFGVLFLGLLVAAIWVSVLRKRGQEP